MSQNPITGKEQNDIVETTVGPIPESGQKQEVVAIYDFARYGGAISTISLATAPIPANAVITNAYLNISIAPVGAGASIALSVQAAGDLRAALAITDTIWNTLSPPPKTLAPEPGTEAGYITTTAVRFVKVVISGAALTAGKFSVVLEYDVIV